MFLVAKARNVVVAIVAIVVLVAGGVCIGLGAARGTGMAEGKTVAIDPGHGGYDAGVSGKMGTRESDVNLSVGQYLAAYLRGAGYEVVMTRTTDRACLPVGSLKRQDMDERVGLINRAKPDLVVSLHCNSYPSVYRRGVQTFYSKGEDEAPARGLMEHLNRTVNAPLGRGFEAVWGEYYLLQKVTAPGVIVECGFLSNAEDEALLRDRHYHMLLAYQIYCGIEAYWGVQETGMWF